MKKRRIRLIGLSIAAFLALNSPAMTLAADSQNAAGAIFDEEIIVYGTKDISQSENADEEIQGQQQQGTGEVILSGTADAGSTDTLLAGRADKAQVQEALERVETYLGVHASNPVVDTINGEWSVMAMARYGTLSLTTRSNYLANLYQKLNDTQGILSTSKYTEYSRVVMALSSIGVNPVDVGGYNLLAPLADLKKVKLQGINGPIFALIALDANAYEVPTLSQADLDAGREQTTREKLIAFILSKEVEGGGWTLFGKTADADMTAMAIQALASYTDRTDVQAAVNRGVNKLSALQEADGGYSSWEEKNLESAAQVVIALSALDVTLIDSDSFIKNGNSLLDAILRFQTEEGSFYHTEGQEGDGMATDQGALALLAWTRSINGQTSLYDMTDVKGSDDEEQESQEKIEAFRQKLNQLPKQVTIKDKPQLYALIAELDQMKTFDEKSEFADQLNAKAKEITEQEKVVDALDLDIWNTIDPLNVTLKDKENVKALLARYENLPKENQEYVEYIDDLKKAEAIIKKLEKWMIVPETVEAETVTVKGTKARSAMGTDTKKTANSNTTASQGTTENTSNTVKTEVKDGIVAKKAFEEVKGKDKNLKISGKSGANKPYTLTINGKDIENAMDMKIGIKEGSKYEADIKKLSENPYIFNFEQTGKFPGKMQVEMTTSLSDGEYLLLKYNQDEKKAEYIQKVEIKDKKTKFLVAEGGDYFISKRAKSQSLDEIVAEEKAEKEENVSAKTTSEPVQEEDTLVTGTKEEKKDYSILIVAAAVVILAAAGGGVVLYKRKKKGDARDEEA